MERLLRGLVHRNFVMERQTQWRNAYYADKWIYCNDTGANKRIEYSTENLAFINPYRYSIRYCY